MPKVPKTTGAQVLPQQGENPLSDPRATAFASRLPSEFVGEGRAASQAQRGIAQLNQTAFMIAKDEFDKANRSAVLEAQNVAMRASIDIVQRMSQRKGKDAFTSASDGTKELNDRLAEINNGLSNAAQRQLFQQTRVGIARNAYARLSAHASRERAIYDDGQLKATASNAEHIYSQTQDPVFLAKIVEVAQEQARRNGMSDEQAKEHVRKIKGLAHANRLRFQIAQGEWAGAQAYMKQPDFIESVSPIMRSKLEKEVQREHTQRSADKVARTIAAMRGDDGELMKFSDMLERAKKASPPEGVDTDEFMKKVSDLVGRYREQTRHALSVDEVDTYKKTYDALERSGFVVDLNGLLDPNNSSAKSFQDMWHDLTPGHKERLRSIIARTLKARRSAGSSAARRRLDLEYFNDFVNNIGSTAESISRGSSSQRTSLFLKYAGTHLQGKVMSRMESLVKQGARVGDVMGKVMERFGLDETKVKDIKDDKLKLAVVHTAFAVQKELDEALPADRRKRNFLAEVIERNYRTNVVSRKTGQTVPAASFMRSKNQAMRMVDDPDSFDVPKSSLIVPRKTWVHSGPRPYIKKTWYGGTLSGPGQTTNVDLVVYPPIAYEKAWARSQYPDMRGDISDDVAARIHVLKKIEGRFPEFSGSAAKYLRLKVRDLQSGTTTPSPDPAISRLGALRPETGAK